MRWITADSTGCSTSTLECGRATRFTLTTLSVGAVRVDPRRFHSHFEMSAAAAKAKRLAKHRAGNTLLIEQRDTSRQPPPTHHEH